MESMLIMTDFSEAAFRAAEYGCEIAPALSVHRILLYHAYQTIVTGTEIPVAIDSQKIYRESMDSLAALRERLAGKAGRSIRLDLLAEEADFPLDVNRLCRAERTDLIVMGFTGKSGFEKLVIGSTAIRVLESSDFPVLFVPSETQPGKGISTIAFAVDLQDPVSLPAPELVRFLDAFNARLHVINIAPAEEKYKPEISQSIAALHQLLEQYRPSFHYLNQDDVPQGILSFGTEMQASLIVIIHRKRNFFQSLFHAGTAKKLVRNSSLPVLSLPGARPD